MAYGSVEGQIDVWEAEEAEGKATPLREREPVKTENEWLYRAWNLMARARPLSPTGMPRAIPYSEIDAYARVNGLDETDTVELALIVAELETTYFDWVEQRSADEDEDTKRREAAQRGDHDGTQNPNRHRPDRG